MRDDILLIIAITSFFVSYFLTRFLRRNNKKKVVRILKTFSGDDDYYCIQHGSESKGYETLKCFILQRNAEEYVSNGDYLIDIERRKEKVILSMDITT